MPTDSLNLSTDHGTVSTIESNVLKRLNPDRDALEELVGVFADLHRRGRRPTIEEFAARYPEYAADIRDLFPMVVAM